MQHERIHAALDGDLPRFLLSDAEEAEAARLEAAGTRAADALRGAPVPAYSARVLAALPADAPAPRRALGARAAAVAERALRWAWAPRTLVLRPAWGLASAMAVVLLLAVGLPGRTPPEPADAPAAAAGAPAIYVQFRLQAADAGQVTLAGSFTDWEPRLELRETEPGVWTAMVPLEPGIHDYLFVVDGEEWVPDPAAYPVDDGFGGTNSRMFLTAPGSAT